jgi:hypothetical protein
VIAHGYRSRYDHRNHVDRRKHEVRVVPRPKRASVEQLRARLDAGEWLLPGEVSALFGKKRWAADNWIVAGKIRFRRSPGGFRECHPDDVGRLLAEYERIQGGEPPPDPTP